jgi:hypothetical protein
MSPIWFPGMVHASDFADSESRPNLLRPPGFWIWPLVIVVAVVIGTVIRLRIQGRLWICECGEVYLWAGDVWSSNNSQHIADPYTLTHLLHGVMFFWLLTVVAGRLQPIWQLVMAVTAEALWEIVENSRFIIDRYREATIALGYEGDTIINSLGDIAICGIGFGISRYLGFRRSIYLFILTEVLLVIWIRDSLILNIIMLIYPLESILNWQMG